MQSLLVPIYHQSDLLSCWQPSVKSRKQVKQGCIAKLLAPTLHCQITKVPRSCQMGDMTYHIRAQKSLFLTFQIVYSLQLASLVFSLIPYGRSSPNTGLLLLKSIAKS